MQASGSADEAMLRQLSERRGVAQKSNRDGTRDDGAIPYAFHQIRIDGDAEEVDEDYVKCAELIARLVQARQRYKGLDKGQCEEDDTAFGTEALDQLRRSNADGPTTTETPLDEKSCLTFRGGVFGFPSMQTQLPTWSQYVEDMLAAYVAIESGPCLSVARMRLNALAEKFRLYSLLNSELESASDRYGQGGGVHAHCTKVDNLVHRTTAMPATTFLDFLIKTATEQPDTPLYFAHETSAATRDPAAPRRVVTLADYLHSHGVMQPQEMTIETLGLHPTLHRNKYVPYDMLSAQSNPAGGFGATLLQAVFSTAGPSKGDLCGAVLRAVLEQQELRKRQDFASELALDLHGHHVDELPQLARWVERQGFNRFERNVWTLAVSRRRPTKGLHSPLPVTCRTIADQLHNLFYPLLQATLHPGDTRYSAVAQLLAHTGSICVQTDAVIRKTSLSTTATDPATLPYDQDDSGIGGSDYYFVYHVWANLVVLNALRVRCGYEALRFRLSVQETAPAYDQLVCGFLLGDVVHHATSLSRSWIMQFLYMLCRVGLVLCPLRDNSLTTPYLDHPVIRCFQQGMRVSLATADPLHFHDRVDLPLMEEHATLMKLRSLTATDMAELARNSVVNSGFALTLKQHWLGAGFDGEDGNDQARSCVCDMRLQFRLDCLLHEEMVLNAALAKVSSKKGGILAKSSHDHHASTTVVVVTGRAGLVDDLVADVPVLPPPELSTTRTTRCVDRRVVFPRIVTELVCRGVSDGGAAALVSTTRTHARAVERLRQVLLLRGTYTNFAVVDVNVEDVFSQANAFDEAMWEYSSYYGVVLRSRVGRKPQWPTFIPTVQQFIRDVETVRRTMSSGALRRLATHRLQLLQRHFALHLALNITHEAGTRAEKTWNNRDFFTAHKVDTNVRSDAGCNARMLLEFFVDKAVSHGDDVVCEEGAESTPVTLRQILERYHIDPSLLTVDELHHQMHTHPDLRRTFLSTDNFMQGRYFAELTKKTLQMYQEDEYSFVEYRLVLDGAAERGWYDLAHWFDRYGMASWQNRWIVSFPHHYRRLRREGRVRNFGEYLDNLFRPLWEISLHPAKDTKFHYFLAHVSGFDCDVDESKLDLPLSPTFPHDWNSELNPPYNMYLYYFWANIVSLNELRAARGLGTFSFRPQCGERGTVEHLIGGLLLGNGISHGVTLAQQPVLEYMYYITQLGVAMSPLSNTDGASPYLENPFPTFFQRGLNVSLATNKPLYFHFTREPLIEEYSIAAKLWQLEFNDLSEIARNSVLQSGFPPAWKVKALGPLYQLRSTLGNEVRRSRVSDIRVAYRYERYHAELDFLDAQLASAVQRMPRAMRTLLEEMHAYAAVSKEHALPPLPRALLLAVAPPPPSSTTMSVRRVREEQPFAASSSHDDHHHGMHDGDSASMSDGGGGAESQEVEDLARALGLPATAQQVSDVQRSVARMEQELHLAKLRARQLEERNAGLAKQINRMRARADMRGLAVLGGLGHDTAPASNPLQSSQDGPMEHTAAITMTTASRSTSRFTPPSSPLAPWMSSPPGLAETPHDQ